MSATDIASRPKKLLDRLPERLHHHAYVVRDHEINRRFFEDVLGIPLVATWCEMTNHPAFGRPVAMCHTFFGMGDGGALAFFQFADPDIQTLCVAERPATVGSFDHVAFKVDQGTYDEIIGRLRGAGGAFRESDHGYCKSVYASSPDGLIVEFTVDPPNAVEIEAVRRADAHTELARWLAGDHRVNNDLRPHA
jgi:glyoxylase I family protein